MDAEPSGGVSGRRGKGRKAPPLLIFCKAPMYKLHLCDIINLAENQQRKMAVERHPRSGDAPSLLLAEGRRGGKPGLTVEPPLILQTDTGAPTPEVDAIYFRTQEDTP